MAAVTNYHRVGGLNQQRFVLSQLWSLEVGNQGVSRVGSFQSSEVESAPCVSPGLCGLASLVFLAYGHVTPFSLSLATCPSPLCLLPFCFIRMLVFAVRAHSNPEWSYLEILNLIVSAKCSPPPRYGHVHRFWGTYVFWATIELRIQAKGILSNSLSASCWLWCWFTGHRGVKCPFFRPRPLSTASREIDTRRPTEVKGAALVVEVQCCSEASYPADGWMESTRGGRR